MSVNKYNSTTGNLERLDGYTVDSTPTSGSGNPVSSGGVYSALAGKLDKTGGTMSGGISFTGQEDVPLPLKTKDVQVVLGQVTWSESTSGKYMATIEVPGLTSDNKILSASIFYVAYIRVGDEFMIQCRNNTFVVCSDVITFDHPDSQIWVRILYI